MRTTTSIALLMALAASGAAAQRPARAPAPKPPRTLEAPFKRQPEAPILKAPFEVPFGQVPKDLRTGVPAYKAPPAPLPPRGAPVPYYVPVPPEIPVPNEVPVPTEVPVPRKVPNPRAVPAPAPMPAPDVQDVPLPAPAADAPLYRRSPAPDHALPPEAVGQDPADILWNQARAEMNRQNYSRAAELFQRLIDRYGRSEHAPNAHYWAAFSLYKRNTTSDLRQAKLLLERQIREHPRASTRTEGEALLVRISGELASRGDAEEARVVEQRAAKAAAQPCPDSEDEEVRAAALSALMRMGSENAVPLLKQIMQRRDACSAELRRTAVYMITRQDTPERETLLLEAVRSDPDPDVKKAAVFWMSQSKSDKAVEAIEEVMRTTTDREVQQVAVHALSQHPSPRAAQVLRDIAISSNVDREVRQAAVHWIGQKDDPANGPFLRDLFNRVDDTQLKESILHILSRRRDDGNAAWLLSIARDAKQPDQIRKVALFWASQGTIPTSEFARLYDSMPDREMKQQILYGLSRRTDSAALEKMIEIAKNDRDPELRKAAVFWLGQSKDPRAIKALQQIAGG